MADSKLSELTYATTAGSSDLLYIVQSATSKKIAVSSLVSSIITIGNIATIVSVPSYSTSTGVQGTLAYDTSSIYICVATNTWKKANLSSW